MSSGNILIPNSPLVDPSTLLLSREWLQWLLNPTFLTVKFDEALGVESGGLGVASNPQANWVLVGTGSSYIPVQYLPISASPGLTGDVLSPQGSITTTLSTVNASPGTYGSGMTVAVVTVNGKGLSTVVSSTPITGSPGTFSAGGAFTAPTATIAGGLIANAANITTTLSALTLNGTSIVGGTVSGTTFTASGAFGCNGATAQTAAAAGAAVATTASTNVTPFGYTTAAQADRIVSLLNTIRAALIANGIMV